MTPGACLHTDQARRQLREKRSDVRPGYLPAQDGRAVFFDDVNVEYRLCDNRADGRMGLVNYSLMALLEGDRPNRDVPCHQMGAPGPLHADRGHGRSCHTNDRGGSAATDHPKAA
jgi:hypothetical protein